MALIRRFYEREGERKHDVEAFIRLSRGYIILDHPGVGILQAGHEVPFDVEGDVALGSLEVNVPGLGKLIGTVLRSDDDAREGDLVFNAILAAPIKAPF